MEVYPSTVYQSPMLFGMDYNREHVEGYSFYPPTHADAILYIKVKLVDGEIVPEKDPNNGLYTYVLCHANPYLWRVEFGTFHDIANVENVNFWFYQPPVDAMIPNMHYVPPGMPVPVERNYY